MPKIAKELTAIEVSRLTKPKPKAGFHFVGTVPGLALDVKPSGAANWVLRVKFGGKRRDIGLGAYPAVTLAMAWDKARAKRDMIAEGKDPIAERTMLRSALLAAQAGALTFRQAAEKYLEFRQGTWGNAKHAQQWANTLRDYAYPALGSLLVRDVETPHVLAALEPIWETKSETASRVRNRIEIILNWSTSRGYRTGLNPARWRGHLDTRLKARAKSAPKDNHPALPIDDMGAFMAELRKVGGAGARALELAILCASRSGEVRGATWGEFDLAAKVWIISAERMKAKREHRIPLSAAAVQLLAGLDRHGETDLLFPSRSFTPISDMTITAVIRRMNQGDKARWVDPRTSRQAVPHGFRSTFKDWASERTAYPSEMAEVALAHHVGSAVERAYRRGDMLEKRRRMMEDWATWCATARAAAASVSPIGQARRP